MPCAVWKKNLAVLAVALLGAGCTATQPAARPALATSYPSPEYPQAAQAVPVPAAPTANATGAPPLAERALASPAPMPAASAARPTTGPAVAPSAAAPAATTEAARPPAPFAALDADGNGRITLEEWRNVQEREFRRHDHNNDGVITRQEMAAPGPAVPGSARPAP